MSSDAIEFRILIKAVWWDKKPKIKVYLNDNVIKTTTLSKEMNEITFTSDLSEGNHAIKIELYGKDNKQTVVNSSGEIEKDQLIDIKDIIIDGVQLGYLVWSKSYFEADKQNPGYEHLPDRLFNFATIGYNGVFVLPFQVPTYIWLLENL